MQRWHHSWKRVLLLGAVLALGLGAAGCSNDLYASCELERGTPCAAQGEGGQKVSCVETQNLQCDTKICARYEGSEPYCTISCEVDGDCTAGVCRTFSPFDKSGNPVRYCVEDTDA